MSQSGLHSCFGCYGQRVDLVRGLHANGRLMSSRAARFSELLIWNHSKWKHIKGGWPGCCVCLVEADPPACLPTCLLQFIIHTPTVLAQKYWITNSAIHVRVSGHRSIAGSSLYLPPGFPLCGPCLPCSLPVLMKQAVGSPLAHQLLVLACSLSRQGSANRQELAAAGQKLCFWQPGYSFAGRRLCKHAY